MRPRNVGAAAATIFLVISAAFILASVATPAHASSAISSSSSTAASGLPSEKTEINWQGVGAVVRPRNASSVRYDVADSAVLQLPDGTFRMYYGNFSEPVDQYGACPPDCPAGTGIDSAVSRDGTHWTVEPGTRVKTQQYGPPAINSVIRLANGTIRLYAGMGNVYSSNDGLNFALSKGTVQVAGATCPGCGLQGPGSYTIVPLANGRYRMYMDQTFNGTDPRFTVVRIYSYISSDGFSFTQESGVRLDSPLQYGSSVIRSGGHPLVYLLANSSWIMYFDTRTVSPPVPTSPGDPSVEANPVGVAISRDGLGWSVSRPTFVESGEAYQLTTAPSGSNTMVFGYYGQPQFPLASYASLYGGGLYYALPFYHIISGNGWYNIGVLTLSTVSSWTFSSVAKQTVFRVATDDPSFLNLTIPSAVLSGTLSVTVDGTLLGNTATVSFNGTDYAVYAPFPSGNHTISISGTSSAQTASTATSTQSTRISTSLSTTTAPSTSTTRIVSGGIPEFPYQLASAAVLTTILVASFLFSWRLGFRRGVANRTNSE